MKITKLSEHVGAEVTGIDLRQPIDEATCCRLNTAVVEHVALVIRDQKFTAQEFLAAASLFGEPMERDLGGYGVPGVPFVHSVSSRDKSKDGTRIKVGARWHTDHTNQVLPPKHTVLYAVELPESGGNTNVANTRAGYASLPDDLKRRLDGMKTANVIVSSAVKNEKANFDSDRVKWQEREKPAPILQPLVRTNPDNGTKALYFHPNKVENIVGMGPEESQALLVDLLERAVKPEFVYSHKWRLGDMFLWDNRSALHKAGFDYDESQHRHLYRVLIRGERPH